MATYWELLTAPRTKEEQATFENEFLNVAASLGLDEEAAKKELEELKARGDQ